MDLTTITTSAVTIFNNISSNYLQYIAFSIAIIIIIFVERPLIGWIVRLAHQQQPHKRFILFLIACVAIIPLLASFLKEAVLMLLQNETGRLIVLIVSLAVIYGIFTWHYKNI